MVLGALLGFFAYATFDLTSMALIQGFSRVVVVDLARGTVLTASPRRDSGSDAGWP
jgi:uncharacterized membrane protein